MKTRRHLARAACAASIALLGAGTAFAGEITGNGKSLKNEDGTLNGKSACAFSGREDTPDEPSPFRGVIAQSFGQIPKPLRDMLIATGVIDPPGESCNPTRAGEEGSN